MVIPTVFLQGSLEVIILLTGKSIRKGRSNTPLLFQETDNPLTVMGRKLQATELLRIHPPLPGNREEKTLTTGGPGKEQGTNNNKAYTKPEVEEVKMR